MTLLHRTAQRLAMLTLAAAGAALAQSSPATPRAPAAPSTPAAPTAPAAGAEISAPAVPSSMDAQLFYQVLLGELTTSGGEPGAGYALMLDAARKNNDATLYQRAADIALQSRSGEAALTAARAWKAAQPDAREPNRYVLQILVALNRIAESAEPLSRELALTPQPLRGLAYSAIPPLYARVSDKPLAATVVEKALAPDLAQPGTAAPAWIAIGRLRLAAGDTPGALDAARQAQRADPASEGPALLALEMLDPKVPLAEPLVRQYLDSAKPLPEVRLAYSRALIDAQRYDEAGQQAQRVTAEKPDLADAWLVQGTLQVQAGQDAPAQASLQRYLELAQAERKGTAQSRGVAQAYLLMAQLAEKRKDYPAAESWLARIDNAQDLVGAQSRRASLLARQGKLDEARQLLRDLPARTPADARMKLSAEVQLLRDNKLYQPAYDLLGAALQRAPNDPDLLYDQAMLADKLGQRADMERLLRMAIAARPDYPHAYNALGYALAERGERLPEARQLIQKALEFAPGDPFISDSLAWVEFKSGNGNEALRILDIAYRTKPDAEIAAHLGEVLWSLGQTRRAIAIWKEGLLINPENGTLRETLQRFKVSP